MPAVGRRRGPGDQAMAAQLVVARLSPKSRHPSHALDDSAFVGHALGPVLDQVRPGPQARSTLCEILHRVPEILRETGTPKLLRSSPIMPSFVHVRHLPCHARAKRH